MRRLLNFIDQHSSRLLWLMIILYSLFFSAVSIWKYNHFLYNGLDLAIINNVFYNTLHGHWFWSSVQGHSYLGDHFTPILIFLLPFYALWQSPEILLILQSLFLALAAWPIYKVSQLVLKDKRLALGLALLWLINPLVHNANLFEFHFISLLPFLFFSLFYYYLKIKTHPHKKLFLCFYVLMLLCLIIREDVVFIILLFLILASLSNLKHKQTLRCLGYGWLIALGWLVVSTLVIRRFSPSGFSPFAYYYHWLLSTDFIFLLKHLLSWANLKMLIGFLLPFLFIPLIRPRWLWLALVPLGQIIFSAHGGGALVWKLHYGLLFMPALMIAFIYGFKQANRLLSQWLGNRFLLIVILIISNLYLWPDFGPLTLKLNQFDFNSSSVKQLVNFIPSSAVVLSSYEFLPYLSGRQHIYALNYYFLGQQQFAQQAYNLPQPPDYLLINFQDLIGFQLNFSQLAWTKPYSLAGAQRLRTLLKDYGIVQAAGQVILLKRDFSGRFNLYSRQPAPNLPQHAFLNFNNLIYLAHYNFSLLKDNQLLLKLVFYPVQPPAKNYQLKIGLSTARRRYQTYLPLVYGIYPSHQWAKGELITVNYWLSVPPDFDLRQLTQLNLSLVNLDGFLTLDKLGVVKLKTAREQISGQPVSLKVEN